MSNESKYEAVIGLEVHAQLLTESKAFCGCSTKFGNAPNTNVCPICLGHPGVLPVLNKKAVEFTVLMGIAADCRINEKSIFARKNYFYPDLPKGYQISQYEEPVCENGILRITLPDNSSKTIRIKRIHMEEDAGKSIHDRADATLVDVNRCGVPLIEIVSEPDIRNAQEASLYLSKIKQIVQYLAICDGNMEEGSLRCDANISVRLKGNEKLGTKTEVKNMNSFRSVERAINREIERQIEIIEDGGKIVQETLLWNADLNDVLSMRSKEEAHDYRYFPEPDLLPVFINKEWINKIKQRLPELPDNRIERFTSQFKIPKYDAEVLTQTRELADYYEELTKNTKDFKSASNWVMGDVLKVLNEEKINIKEFPVKPESLAQLINIINDGTISGKIAKEIFPEMVKEKKRPLDIVKGKNLLQVSDRSEIEKIIEQVLNVSPSEVKEYIEGKEKVFGYFVGKIMRESRGKANPKVVNEVLREKLELLKN
ncbi:MAG TPA: Asp-tRNA(Asn)/Glu-tRNA(Gln) amidotransferase subunit GatB [Ignavibacteriaceae bacterium]|nr:Asp-tRNA(Asn)/Glu-tRNA(Gln) amidotransferase subunit GatB [Ignavibacteriaceae bacterium]